MSESKHTPAPWRLQFLGAHEADLIHKGTLAGINGGSGCPDQLSAEDYTIWEANARLIAEAPSLLLALRDAVAAWDRWFQKLPTDAEDDEFGAFLRARTAIAKATG